MELVFDVIIFGFLIGSVAGIIAFCKFGAHKCSVFVSDAIILLIAIAWCVVFYGSFIESRFIVVNEQTIDTKESPAGYLHAVVISDIHAGGYKGKAFVQELIDTINQAHPDVVFLLGDFVQQHASEATALAPFKTFTSVYPTYAVLGNHDYQLEGDHLDPAWQNANNIESLLESYGVHVLRNEGLLIRDGLWVAGVEEVWTGQVNLDAALQGRPAGTQTIALVHNPDLVLDLQPNHEIDLVLAGHTHGGQIRLPLIGPVPALPTKLGRAYDKGLFDYQDQKLFITSGVGESGPRARLFNPPEIVSIFIGY